MCPPQTDPFLREGEAGPAQCEGLSHMPTDGDVTAGTFDDALGGEDDG